MMMSKQLVHSAIHTPQGTLDLVEMVLLSHHMVTSSLYARFLHCLHTITYVHTKIYTHTQGTLDLVEMVLAKADPRVAVLYDRKLVAEPLWPLGEEIRAR